MVGVSGHRMKTFPIKVGKGRNALTLDAGKVIDRCALIQGGAY